MLPTKSRRVAPWVQRSLPTRSFYHHIRGSSATTPPVDYPFDTRSNPQAPQPGGGRSCLPAGRREFEQDLSVGRCIPDDPQRRGIARLFC